jgi:hypothetical protein
VLTRDCVFYGVGLSDKGLDIILLKLQTKEMDYWQNRFLKQAKDT